jgi:threonine aldolase
METRALEAPVNLRSDNVAGIAPEILAAIEAANAGSAPSYGADPITARLQDIFAELFETACFVQPVATGTATNALALALIAPPYGAIYCTDVGHVHDSECGGRRVLYRRRQNRAACRGARPAAPRHPARRAGARRHRA